MRPDTIDRVDGGDSDVGRDAEPIATHCPRPVERPVMLQGWHDLTSIHWPYDPAVVQRILPDGLRVDTCQGRAWVGVIPFRMRRIRVPGLPALGPLSTFPETNVRTYVVMPDGRRGVWFASLDVSRLLPAAVARVSYGLPYCWSAMSIRHHGQGLVEYTTCRRWPTPGPSSRVVVQVGAAVPAAELGEIERFVTARWSLASTFAGRPLRADVDHDPWTLHRARLILHEDSLVTAVGLPEPTGRPVVLYSRGVEVRIGRPRSIPDERRSAVPIDTAVPEKRDVVT